MKHDCARCSKSEIETGRLRIDFSQLFRSMIAAGTKEFLSLLYSHASVPPTRGQQCSVGVVGGWMQPFCGLLLW